MPTSSERMRRHWTTGGGLLLLVMAGVALAAWIGRSTASTQTLRPTDLTEGAPSKSLSVQDWSVVSPATVARFGRFEATFNLPGSVATHAQWPFDPAPPPGIPPGVGISVTGIFVDPTGQQWHQPAFIAEAFRDEIRQDRDWHLATGRLAWHVRFTPHLTGRWRVHVVARDRTGWTRGPEQTFEVGGSAQHGFVRVSARDPRYFQFHDGTRFNGVGHQFQDQLADPIARGAAAYRDLARHGINFVRVAVSAIYGSAWSPWVGGRNQYRGYLPYTGLVPYGLDTGDRGLTMRLDREPDGDTGWFDQCRVQAWNNPESVEPGVAYRIQVHYAAEGLRSSASMSTAGTPALAPTGLVVRIGADCSNPGAAMAVASSGVVPDGWHDLVGTWIAQGPFLPAMLLHLDRIATGAVFIRSVSLRADLGNGTFGPELMERASFGYDEYVPEERAYSLDRVLEQAEAAGVFLKLVVLEKNDKMFLKLEDDGRWVSGPDNEDGFYGTGRHVNRTRWLQQMWWRYLQARWGYSSAVHSWELTNEADPGRTDGYAMADEFAKFMHCRVFDVAVPATDGQPCALRHPNAHLVTTSLWSGFPSSQFWGNWRYPNLDYADLHAYASTSPADAVSRTRMQEDEAEYHLWHGRLIQTAHLGKPVVRGEAGLDAVDRQSETALGLERDRDGVWLHNFLWSTLDASGLFEIYWYSHLTGSGFDHREEFSRFRRFSDDLPLHEGGYVDAEATAGTTEVRVVGQKNPARGLAHLWIQNRRHTWKAVVDREQIAPVETTVTLSGFRPGTLTCEWWDTWSGTITGTEHVAVGADGRLHLSVASLTRDVALRIRPTSTGGQR